MSPPSLKLSNMLLGKSRELLTAPERMKLLHQRWKQRSVVDVSGDESKIQYCKEQHCIGTWNVSSMSQGKLNMVKQEMVRENINILVISELEWMGMGEFNSDELYIYTTLYYISTTVGKNPLDVGSPHSQQESKLKYLSAVSKMTE